MDMSQALRRPLDIAARRFVSKIMRSGPVKSALRTSAFTTPQITFGLKPLSPLLSSQPIANPHTKLLSALDAPNSRREIKIEKPGGRGLVSEPTHGCEPQIDRRRSIMGLFGGGPVPGHHDFVDG